MLDWHFPTASDGQLSTQLQAFDCFGDAQLPVHPAMLKLHRPSSCTLALFPRQPSRKFVPQHPLQAIKSCRHRSLSRSVGLSKGRPLGARSATEASVSGRGSAAPEPPSLAVFVSGGGSNFRAIHKAVLEGQIAARVAVSTTFASRQAAFHSTRLTNLLTGLQVVVSDVPQCGACEYAAEEGIPIIAYPASLSKAEASHDHNAETPEELTQLLTAVYRVQFVLLAGYLKVRSSNTTDKCHPL